MTQWRDIAEKWFERWRGLVILTMPFAVLGFVEPMVLASVPGVVGYVPLLVLRRLDGR
ncbi:hypothetical protein [Sphingomonas sp. PvP018]|uniref:hypothetical protein n=1 Tax=Sphingomonas sp. PvP018 TaxID=2817852 RepID=UPI001AEAF22D|nr:hypothetical protein [Sphingomonas sp. PvP018]MBP2513822.1 hypothetical protein [Sphingomonas sp. PvP018]